MSKTTLDTIRAIILRDRKPEKSPNKAKAPYATPLVTISRMYGCDGGKIARLLADELDVRFFDRALLKAVVKQAQADKGLLEVLDERATGVMDDLLHSFFSKKSTTKDDYFRYMAKVILSVSANGGVIVGRGANLLIPSDRPALRVRLEGSLEVCAKRVAKRQEIKQSKAEKLVLETTDQREAFVKSLRKKLDPPNANYDLIINTDVFQGEQAVRLILKALKLIGFDVGRKK